MHTKPPNNFTLPSTIQDPPHTQSPTCFARLTLYLTCRRRVSVVAVHKRAVVLALRPAVRRTVPVVVERCTVRWARSPIICKNTTKQNISYHRSTITSQNTTTYKRHAHTIHNRQPTTNHPSTYLGKCHKHWDIRRMPA